ncbi:hypothetical protein, partial [Novipirellula maiorica]|uniref:hypothetical protein n=1 Tax=Novipirellula maiorica TaxID=1265734 RepID=UPI000592763C
MSRISFVLLALFLLPGVVSSSSARGSCGDWLAHPTAAENSGDHSHADAKTENSVKTGNASDARESRPTESQP